MDEIIFFINHDIDAGARLENPFGRNSNDSVGSIVHKKFTFRQNRKYTQKTHM